MTKEKMGIILISLFIASETVAQAGWFPVGDGIYAQEPQITVLESSHAGATINLKLSGFWVENVQVGDRIYQKLRLYEEKSGAQTIEVGKPMLPYICKSVAIPPKSGVKLTIEEIKKETFDNYVIYPAQIPKSYSQSQTRDTSAVLSIDEEFYSSDQVYPIDTELSVVGQPATMHDVRFVNLRFSPVQYSPAEDEIHVITDMTIRLDYSGFSSNTLEPANRPVSSFWQKVYESSGILNLDDIYGQDRLQVEFDLIPIPGYLIIYAPNSVDGDPYDGVSYFSSFVAWKNKFGVHVDCVDLYDIPGINGATDDWEDVRDYIIDWYNDCQTPPTNELIDPTYVLLIGDAQTAYAEGTQAASLTCVPTYYNDDHPVPCQTDYFYADLTDDYYPELAVGRWPSTSAFDCEKLARKVVAYELPETFENPHGKLFVAAKQEYPIDCDSLKTAIEYSNFWAMRSSWVTEAYGDDGDDNDDVKDVIDAEGVGVVNYIGHGDVDRWWNWNKRLWGNQHFTNDDVLDLCNSFEYPIVFNMSCLNGYFTQPTECLCETWVVGELAGGAVAAFGATEEAYSPNTEDMDWEIFLSLYDNLLTNCGSAVIHAKEYILDTYNNWLAENDACKFTWFGDPELDVWHTYTHNAQIEWVSCTEPNWMDIRVTYSGGQFNGLPVYPAKVCVWNPNGSYHRVAMTDASGMAHLPYPWPETGTFYMACKSQDEPAVMPTVGTFTIYSAPSANVEEQPTELIEWRLESINPNPFKTYTSISYSVAGDLSSTDGNVVELSIFDATGRKIKQLISGKQSPGHYTVNWNGCDEVNQSCSPGVYFVKMQALGYYNTRKITLLR